MTARQQPASQRQLRILLLVTEAHGGFGGIAQYNRNLVQALTRLPEVGEVVVLPRIVHGEVTGVPDKATYDYAAAGGVRRYLGRWMAQGLASGAFDLVICGHINLAPLAVLTARAKRVPCVLIVHGIDAWTPPPGKLAGHAAPHANLVVAVSETTRERFLSWCRLDRSRTAIVTNCVEQSDFGMAPKALDLVARHGLDGTKVIMTFGRMSRDERYKGFDEVIGLVSRLAAVEPSIRYLAAGDGDDRLRLEALARSAGVADRVVFAGRIPEERKADYLRLADAFVMPSHGEGFGIVILEALACGVPVVASTADGTREAVRNGELGLVVDPKDPLALEAAILEALRRPKSLLPGLSHFSFASFEAQLREALASVIEIDANHPVAGSYSASK